MCGLVWTIFLIIMAGGMRTNKKATGEIVDMVNHYCVMSAEECCKIDPDNPPLVFYHVFTEGY